MSLIREEPRGADRVAVDRTTSGRLASTLLGPEANDGRPFEERFGLPEYLLRTCPSSLREGRRLKTKFRLGCHDLRSSSSRTQLVRNAQCPCCKSRESETIQHALLECSAFTKERDTFLERFYELHPIARGLSPEGLCDVLMSDDLPHETENTMYRYLIAISRLRLGILTERGEGS